MEIKAGDIVRCAYRGSHEGIVLAVDDPEAWKGSIAFPLGATRAEVRAHLDRLASIGVHVLDKTPVLWRTFPEPKVYWDRDLTVVGSGSE